MIVAGGVSKATTEVLFMSRLSDGWQKGPDLPLKLGTMASVVTSDEKALILVAGHEYQTNQESTSLYKIYCANGVCHVEKMLQQLKIGRSYPVAMLIPDSLTSCT